MYAVHPLESKKKRGGGKNRPGSEFTIVGDIVLICKHLGDSRGMHPIDSPLGEKKKRS